MSPLRDASLYRETHLAPFHPVDTASGPGHLIRVSKKSHKVGEPASPYPAKPTAKDSVRHVELEKVRQANAKLIQVHRTVLQKLAQ